VQQVDLLRSLPKAKRNINARKSTKTPEMIAIAKQYGEEYFDGPREFGYGGYKYDGRWWSVAVNIINHYDLGIGARILDVGCAKGFLVNDLMYAVPSLEAFGLDISRYAIMHCFPPNVIGRLHLGSADDLPFPDQSFDLVLSINTLHNLPRSRLIRALQEINRVSRSRGNAFVQVDSYNTPEQKELFEDWVLTAEYHGYPEDWLELFRDAGYTGDYDWTIVE